VFGGTVLPTYTQMRAAGTLFRAPGGCMGGPLIPPLPAAGTLMVSAYASGGCG